MSNKIGIINYGMGNIRSVENAVKKLNFNVSIVKDPEDINNVDKLILPGVGSFKEAMKLLNTGNWIEKINFNVIQKKKPIFGICLGMQLFGSSSEEFGFTKGFNFIDGEIKSLKNIGCINNLPQIGWNSIKKKNEHIFMNGIPDNTDFYFVNSFAFKPKDTSNIISETDYGVKFCSVIAKDNIFGTQFHPEKSSKAGNQLLKNFLDA
jgi:glutamine amidotransferase